jgi:hypothetical protein
MCRRPSLGWRPTSESAGAPIGSEADKDAMSASLVVPKVQTHTDGQIPPRPLRRPQPVLQHGGGVHRI